MSDYSGIEIGNNVFYLHNKYYLQVVIFDVFDKIDFGF